MYFAYSTLLSLAFLVMLPLFILRREKYASGFRQRLGNYPSFVHEGRDVIWLHCVSVGETNAARPLVEKLRESFPDHRLVISTTTKTGQELAHKIFTGKADAIVYFPFDWKFSVRRALENYKPSLVLLMETEIWPRFIHESKLSGAKVAIVNGRLSKKSFENYSRFRSFVSGVLDDIDLALMQADADAERILRLGINESKVAVTGNLKFEQTADSDHRHLTEEFRTRFGVDSGLPLIIAASTHEPEERYVLDAIDGSLGTACRLMIVPRHSERFDAVARVLDESQYSYVRRSDPPTDDDKVADVILLDSIGELRGVYPLSEIVFVGGSLIPHGGQSILEPAAEGKAIITGPHTHNFESVVREFLEHDAVRRVADVNQLESEFAMLLQNESQRRDLGANAVNLMNRENRDGVDKTVSAVRKLVDEKELAA